MIHQQFRIIDLLTWTTLIAANLATFMMGNPYYMIAALPCAFIVSLIRQPFTSPRMWTSFLFSVLLSGWLGVLSFVILLVTFSWPGMSGVIAIGISLIVPFFASMVVPCFIGSLREKKCAPRTN